MIYFSHHIIWPKNIAEAKLIQLELKDKAEIIPPQKQPRFIAGVDAAFTEEKVIGVACLYRFPEISFVEETCAMSDATFPYIPGFLSFREGPAIMGALEKLTITPDIILFDGQGIAHPKKLGIASHIGILLDMPTIGCAKSRLVGKYREPSKKKGGWSPLRYNDEIVGAVLRTKENVKPVFVSPGHLIDVEASIEIIIKCTSKHRIPDPLRAADYLSRKIRRESSMP